MILLIKNFVIITSKFVRNTTYRLRHKKRRNYLNGFKNKLDSLHENNPKLFWNFLNSVKSENNDEDSSSIDAK